MQIYDDFGVELGVWIARGRTPERDELWMEYIQSPPTAFSTYYSSIAYFENIARIANANAITNPQCHDSGYAICQEQSTVPLSH